MALTSVSFSSAHGKHRVLPSLILLPLENLWGSIGAAAVWSGGGLQERKNFASHIDAPPEVRPLPARPEPERRRTQTPPRLCASQQRCPGRWGSRRPMRCRTRSRRLCGGSARKTPLPPRVVGSTASPTPSRVKGRRRPRRCRLRGASVQGNPVVAVHPGGRR